MTYKRKTIPKNCLFCQKSFFARIEKNKEQVFCSLNCSLKSRATEVTKNCAICSKNITVKKVRVREKNYCSREHASLGSLGKPAWNQGKGTISRPNELFRKSKEYKLWRQAVFQRDNYTCRLCCQRGGELNADHIKPFALFPELRLAIDNGRTLCVHCHRKTDTYGYAFYNKNKKKKI